MSNTIDEKESDFDKGKKWFYRILSNHSQTHSKSGEVISMVILFKNIILLQILEMQLDKSTHYDKWQEMSCYLNYRLKTDRTTYRYIFFFCFLFQIWVRKSILS